MYHEALVDWIEEINQILHAHTEFRTQPFQMQRNCLIYIDCSDNLKV
jgi:hypothetical protein